jgi:phosphoribosylanthranilate isomerase
MVAAEAGADFIGLVLAPSKRQVSPQTARQVAREMKRFGPHPMVVGVFVNALADEVNRLVDFCGLDWVQLSGDESWEYCWQIDRPIMKAIHVSTSKVDDEIIAEISRGSEILTSKVFTCLLDVDVKDSYGGTGQTFEWKQANRVARRYDVVIAGGLSPQNVGQAIKMVSPWGVDVSSGVESSGSKDVAQIKAFVQAVRRADEEAQ